MKKTVSIMLAALLIFVMGACSTGGGSGSVAGTYKMKSVTTAGQTMDVETLITAAGLDINDFKLELKEDGNYSVTLFTGDGSETATGTWEADGDKVKITTEGTTQEATLDGNKLIISQDGTEVVFEK